MPSSASQLDDPMPSVDANSSYVFGNTSPEYSNPQRLMAPQPLNQEELVFPKLKQKKLFMMEVMFNFSLRTV